MLTATYRGPPILPILGVVVTFFGLFLGALYLQRHVFPPANELVAGPMHGGAWYMVPAFLASMYLLFSIVLLASAAQRRGIRYRSGELLRLLYTGRLGQLNRRRPHLLRCRIWIRRLRLLVCDKRRDHDPSGLALGRHDLCLVGRNQTVRILFSSTERPHGGFSD